MSKVIIKTAAEAFKGTHNRADCPRCHGSGYALDVFNANQTQYEYFASGDRVSYLPIGTNRVLIIWPKSWNRLHGGLYPVWQILPTPQAAYELLDHSTVWEPGDEVVMTYKGKTYYLTGDDLLGRF